MFDGIQTLKPSLATKQAQSDMAPSAILVAQSYMEPFGKSYATALSGMKTFVPLVGDYRKVALIGDNMSVQLNKKVFQERLDLFHH